MSVNGAKRSASETPRVAARRSMFWRLTFCKPLSTLPTYVRCSPARSAKPSCDQPRSVRSCRILVPNCLRMSFIPSSLEAVPLFVRQSIASQPKASIQHWRSLKSRPRTVQPASVPEAQPTPKRRQNCEPPCHLGAVGRQWDAPIQRKVAAPILSRHPPGFRFTGRTLRVALRRHAPGRT